MAGSPSDESGVDDGEPTTGTPRWVKMAWVLVIVVALLSVVLLVAGRGGHGPGRHTDRGFGAEVALSDRART